MATGTETGRQTRIDTVGRLAVVLHTFPALANRHYRWLWFGSLETTFANQMSMIASGYAAFVLTGSATVLGVVSSAMAFPMLFVPLAGGVVADRASRRTVIMASQIVMLLATSTVAALAFMGALEVWHLFALNLIRGGAFSFNMPARQAYTGDVVGPDLLRSAVALQNAGHNFNRVAGPALAGVVLALPTVGIGGAFTVMAVMYGAAFLTTFQIPDVGSPGASETGGRGLGGWSQLVEGLTYVARSPTLFLVLVLGSLPMLLGMSYQTLLPLFAEEVYGAGARGLGILSTATGVGALAGSLVVAARMQGAHLGILQRVAGLGFGLGLLAFGASPALLAAAAAIAFVGFAQAAYLAVNNTLLMTNSEPRLYGRVMGLQLVAYGFMPFATIPAGWIADQIGGPATIVATGALVILVIVAGALYPPYRRVQ